MISLALVADAIIGNLQEKTIKQYQASNSEVVLYSYSIGFVYLFFLVAVFTDIASAIHYCSYYPKQTYGYAFIFSITGYLGIQVDKSSEVQNSILKSILLDCVKSCSPIWSLFSGDSHHV